MSTQALARRLWRLEEQEALAFGAFLLRLSDADSRTFQMALLEALAAQGFISSPPADLWKRPQPEKDAFLLMFRESIESGRTGAGAVLRQHWRAGEQEHMV